MIPGTFAKLFRQIPVKNIGKSFSSQCNQKMERSNLTRILLDSIENEKLSFKELSSKLNVNKVCYFLLLLNIIFKLFCIFSLSSRSGWHL